MKTGEIRFNNPRARTGFPLKFLDPFYRKLFLDRTSNEQEELEKSVADRSPPQKDKETESEKNIHKLEDLVEMTTEPLLKISTAIPFNPFPTDVIVDINKVNILYRYFFRSEHIHSIFIKDISDVIVETSLFFSTLSIVDVGFTENSIDVCYLRTKDAIRARKLIQGLIIAHKNGIEFAKFNLPNLTEKLEELGKVEEEK